MADKSWEKITLEDVVAVRDTANALLCRVDGREVWIPKKLIDDDSETYKAGTSGTLIIPEWLAIEKQLV